MAEQNQPIIESRNAILVLGMHRSGTSAMTRVLNILGAELGRDLLPSKEDNAAGFWENEAVVQANEHLLKALGLTWHDPVTLPPRSEQQPAIRHFCDAVKQLLDKQFGEAPLIALKDPRLSRFAPVWTEVLAAEGILPKIVVMVRHPAEVTRSLKKRDGFSEPKSQLLWFLHTIESMFAAEGFPHVYVRYDRLVADWRTEVARVAAALDVVWPCDVESVASQIDAFIDPGLRHHIVVAEAPGNAMSSDGPAISGKIVKVYEACAAMAEDAPSAKVEILDLLREVKPWLDVFGGPAREIALQAQMLANELHSQSVVHLAADADKDVVISSLRSSVQALERERETARANIDDLAAQILAAREAHDALERERETARANIDDLAAQILAAREAHDALERERETARANIDDLAAQVLAAKEAHDARDRVEENLRKSLSHSMSELAISQASTSSLVDEVRAATVTIDGLVNEISAARENTNDLVAEIDRARDAYAARMAEIDAARDTIQGLVGELQVARSARDIQSAREAELSGLLSQRDIDVAEIGDAMAGVESRLIETVRRGDRQEAVLKQIQSARWTRFGRLLGLVRGE